MSSQCSPFALAAAATHTLYPERRLASFPRHPAHFSHMLDSALCLVSSALRMGVVSGSLTPGASFRREVSGVVVSEVGFSSASWRAALHRCAAENLRHFEPSAHQGTREERESPDPAGSNTRTVPSTALLLCSLSRTFFSVSGCCVRCARRSQ